MIKTLINVISIECIIYSVIEQGVSIKTLSSSKVHIKFHSFIFILLVCHYCFGSMFSERLLAQATVVEANNCTLVYNTAHLMPYWVVVLQVILFYILNEFFAWFLSKLMDWWKGEKPADKLPTVNLKNVVLVIPKQEDYEPSPKSGIGVKEGIDLCQGAYFVAVTIYLIVLAAAAKGDFTGWDRYQLLYGSMLNSFPGNFICSRIAASYISTDNVSESSDDPDEETADTNVKTDEDEAGSGSGSGSHTFSIANQPSGKDSENLTTSRSSSSTADNKPRINLLYGILVNRYHYLKILYGVDALQTRKIKLDLDNCVRNSRIPFEESSMLPLLVLAPAFVTHILPGIVLYFWIMVIISYVVSNFQELSKWIAKRLGTERGECTPGSYEDYMMGKVQMLGWVLVIHLCVYFLMQTLYNITFFYYSGDGYIDSVGNDILYRNTHCYLTRSLDSIQGVISFFSFV